MLKSRVIFIHGPGCWDTFNILIERRWVEKCVRRYRIKEAKENYEKPQRQREWMGAVPRAENRWIKLNISVLRCFETVPDGGGLDAEARRGPVKQKSSLEGEEGVTSFTVCMWEGIRSWHPQMEKWTSALEPMLRVRVKENDKIPKALYFSPTFSSCLIPQWEGNNQEPITDKEIAPIIQPQFHKTIRWVTPVEGQLIHKSHICISRQEKLTCTIMCSVSLSHKKTYISDVT